MSKVTFSGLWNLIKGIQKNFAVFILGKALQNLVRTNIVALPGAARISPPYYLIKDNNDSFTDIGNENGGLTNIDVALNKCSSLAGGSRHN